MPHQKPSSFNLDTDYGYEKLRQIEQEQANLSQAEKENHSVTTNVGTGLMTAKAFEKWKKEKDSNTINPFSEIEGKFDATASSLSDKIDAAADVGNIKKVERLTKKLEKAGGGLEDSLGGGGGGLNYGAGAITAAQQLPGIISNFSDRPTTGGEANSIIANTTMSFAQIGLSVGGPWGAAIGAVAGAATGIISNAGWYDEVLADNDAQVTKGLEQDRKDRMRDYIKNRTSDQLEAEGKAYSRALGYSGRSLTA